MNWPGSVHNTRAQMRAAGMRQYLTILPQLRQNVLHHKLVHNPAVVAKGLRPAFLSHTLVHVDHDIGRRNVRRDAEFLAAVRHVHVHS